MERQALTVTSVDIGDRNLAIAQLSGSRRDDGHVDVTAIDIKLEDLKVPEDDSDDGVPECLAKVLADPKWHDVDAVVIEQQLRHAQSLPKQAQAHNTRMVALAAAVRQHFVTTKILRGAARPYFVGFISAAAKLNLLDLPPGPIVYKRYSDPKGTRKDVSKAIATAFLAGTELGRYVDGLKKKDDVSDAYLQGRAWLERELADPVVLKAGRSKWSSADHRYVKGDGTRFTSVPARGRKPKPAPPPSSTIVFE